MGRGSLHGREQPRPSPFHFTHGWHWQTDTVTRAGVSELRLSAPVLGSHEPGGWREKRAGSARLWLSDSCRQPFSRTPSEVGLNRFPLAQVDLPARQR